MRSRIPSAAGQPARRYVPGWRVLCALVVLAACLTSASSFAGAQTTDPLRATVEARQERNYGRIVLTFSREVTHDVEIASSVLVLTLSEKVAVELGLIAKTIPGFVVIARQDPDGKTMRLALARGYRVNTIKAGKKLFIDLLPPEWSGDPPALPQAVITELARRAAEAEAKIQEARRQRVEAADGYHLKIRVGEHPTFTRIAFDWNKVVVTKFTRENDKVRLHFKQKVDVDLRPLTVEPPKLLRSAKLKTTDSEMTVELDVDEDAEVRSFREGTVYIVDLSAGAHALKNAASDLSDRISDAAGTPADAGPRTGLTSASDDAGEKADAGGEAQSGVVNPPPADEVGVGFTPFDPTLSADAFGDGDGTPPPIGMAPANPLESEGETETAERTPRGRTEPELELAPVAQATPPRLEPPAKLIAADETPSDEVDALPVATRKVGQTIKMTFGFSKAVSAAVFHRGKTVWMVFDTPRPFDTEAIMEVGSHLFERVDQDHAGPVRVLRLRLKSVALTSAAREDRAWTVAIGDLLVGAARPLHLKRAVRSDRRSIMSVTYENPGRVHWLRDPELGDRLAVVTAFGPTRGFVKDQDFVEFSALATAHGLVVRPRSDDLAVRLNVDEVLITRLTGLTLSAGGAHQYLHGRETLGRANRPGFIDATKWRRGDSATLFERLGQSMRAIAASNEEGRSRLRLDLARLYLAHEMAPEALGVLQRLVEDDPGAENDPLLNAVRGAALAMRGDTAAAMRDLQVHALANDKDAALWRALADAKDKNWRAALEALRAGEHVIGSYPDDLQTKFRLAAARAALHIRALRLAAAQLEAIPDRNMPKAQWVARQFLNGWYMELTGRTDAALQAYEAAEDADKGAPSNEARFRRVALQHRIKSISNDKAIDELEALALIWRGDDIELNARQLLASLHVQQRAYRKAFQVMRSAIKAFPKAPIALRIQDDMQQVFGDLFLHGKADDLPPVDALALYYDYRELTPVGRLGDDMIRRLANRLIAIDLLDPASELLDYQVKKRLRGVARAQVATRLAMVQMMNRKPSLALKTVRTTRQADLPKELQRRRNLLEARALTEIGRAEAAVEVLNRTEGSEVERLKADAWWNGQRWKQAGEQFERMLGGRWKISGPLNETDRVDVLRAAIAYSLADDQFALQRVRKKFTAKMENSPDADAFSVVTKAITARGPAFRELAKTIAAIDTLDAFMKSYRARYDVKPLSKAPDGAGVSG